MTTTQSILNGTRVMVAKRDAVGVVEDSFISGTGELTYQIDFGKGRIGFNWASQVEELPPLAVGDTIEGKFIVIKVTTVGVEVQDAAGTVRLLSGWAHRVTLPAGPGSLAECSAHHIAACPFSTCN